MPDVLIIKFVATPTQSLLIRQEFHGPLLIREERQAEAFVLENNLAKRKEVCQKKTSYTDTVRRKETKNKGPWIMDFIDYLVD